MSSRHRRSRQLDAVREALTADHEPGIVKHMVDRQVLPQLRAAELRERGVDVQTAFVSTDPDAPGWEVTCLDCGRTSKLGRDPGVKVALCPDCQRRRGL